MGEDRSADALEVPLISDSTNIAANRIPISRKEVGGKREKGEVKEARSEDATKGQEDQRSQKGHQKEFRQEKQDLRSLRSRQSHAKVSADRKDRASLIEAREG
ncbi:hypothetical protein OESDEN_18062 [Oesophagostomum dentatum]|uniref:Uncharacterized protein n=1 Tax=Oesophagostomum dentatum TaxID=61180 RepID=A0A0B1SED1_OESDE|nr:hypothetical protein OESDEN_18062 [Oesophagostomum dentatum]